MSKINFKDEILEEVAGEEIVGVVIGNMGWGTYNKDNIPLYDVQPKGKVLSWKEAAPFLDYEHDCGYGAPECNAVYVWTETKVYFVVQYDGSTGFSWVPRDPVDIMPEMPGG